MPSFPYSPKTGTSGLAMSPTAVPLSTRSRAAATTNAFQQQYSSPAYDTKAAYYGQPGESSGGAYPWSRSNSELYMNSPQYSSNSAYSNNNRNNTNRSSVLLQESERYQSQTSVATGGGGLLKSIGSYESQSSSPSQQHRYSNYYDSAISTASNQPQQSHSYYYKQPDQYPGSYDDGQDTATTDYYNHHTSRIQSSYYPSYNSTTTDQQRQQSFGNPRSSSNNAAVPTNTRDSHHSHQGYGNPLPQPPTYHPSIQRASAILTRDTRSNSYADYSDPLPPPVPKRVESSYRNSVHEMQNVKSSYRNPTNAMSYSSELSTRIAPSSLTAVTYVDDGLEYKGKEARQTNGSGGVRSTFTAVLSKPPSPAPTSSQNSSISEIHNDVSGSAASLVSSRKHSYQQQPPYTSSSNSGEIKPSQHSSSIFNSANDNYQKEPNVASYSHHESYSSSYGSRASLASPTSSYGVVGQTPLATAPAITFVPAYAKASTRVATKPPASSATEEKPYPFAMLKRLDMFSTSISGANTGSTTATISTTSRDLQKGEAKLHDGGSDGVGVVSRVTARPVSYYPDSDRPSTSAFAVTPVSRVNVSSGQSSYSSVISNSSQSPKLSSAFSKPILTTTANIVRATEPASSVSSTASSANSSRAPASIFDLYIKDRSATTSSGAFEKRPPLSSTSASSASKYTSSADYTQDQRQSSPAIRPLNDKPTSASSSYSALLAGNKSVTPTPPQMVASRRSTPTVVGVAIIADKQSPAPTSAISSYIDKYQKSTLQFQKPKSSAVISPLTTATSSSLSSTTLVSDGISSRPGLADKSSCSLNKPPTPLPASASSLLLSSKQATAATTATTTTTSQSFLKGYNSSSYNTKFPAKSTTPTPTFTTISPLTTPIDGRKKHDPDLHVEENVVLLPKTSRKTNSPPLTPPSADPAAAIKNSASSSFASSAVNKYAHLLQKEPFPRTSTHQRLSQSYITGDNGIYKQSDKLDNKDSNNNNNVSPSSDKESQSPSNTTTTNLPKPVDIPKSSTAFSRPIAPAPTTTSSNRTSNGSSGTKYPPLPPSSSSSSSQPQQYPHLKSLNSRGPQISSSVNKLLRRRSNSNPHLLSISTGGTFSSTASKKPSLTTISDKQQQPATSEFPPMPTLSTVSVSGTSAGTSIAIDNKDAGDLIVPAASSTTTTTSRLKSHHSRTPSLTSLKSFSSTTSTSAINHHHHHHASTTSTAPIAGITKTRENTEIHHDPILFSLFQKMESMRKDFDYQISQYQEDIIELECIADEMEDEIEFLKRELEKSQKHNQKTIDKYEEKLIAQEAEFEKQVKDVRELGVVRCDELAGQVVEWTAKSEVYSKKLKELEIDPIQLLKQSVEEEKIKKEMDSISTTKTQMQQQEQEQQQQQQQYQLTMRTDNAGDYQFIKNQFNTKRETGSNEFYQTVKKLEASIENSTLALGLEVQRIKTWSAILEVVNNRNSTNNKYGDSRVCGSEFENKMIADQSTVVDAGVQVSLVGSADMQRSISNISQNSFLSTSTTTESDDSSGDDPVEISLNTLKKHVGSSLSKQLSAAAATFETENLNDSSCCSTINIDDSSSLTIGSSSGSNFGTYSSKSSSLSTVITPNNGKTQQQQQQQQQRKATTASTLSSKAMATLAKIDTLAHSRNAAASAASGTLGLSSGGSNSGTNISNSNNNITSGGTYGPKFMGTGHWPPRSPSKSPRAASSIFDTGNFTGDQLLESLKFGNFGGNSGSQPSSPALSGLTTAMTTAGNGSSSGLGTTRPLTPRTRRAYTTALQNDNNNNSGINDALSALNGNYDSIRLPNVNSSVSAKSGGSSTTTTTRQPRFRGTYGLHSRARSFDLSSDQQDSSSSLQKQYQKNSTLLGGLGRRFVDHNDDNGDSSICSTTKRNTIDGRRLLDSLEYQPSTPLSKGVGVGSYLSHKNYHQKEHQPSLAELAEQLASSSSPLTPQQADNQPSTPNSWVYINTPDKQHPNSSRRISNSNSNNNSPSLIPTDNHQRLITNNRQYTTTNAAVTTSSLGSPLRHKESARQLIENDNSWMINSENPKTTYPTYQHSKGSSSTRDLGLPTTSLVKPSMIFAKQQQSSPLSTEHALNNNNNNSNTTFKPGDNSEEGIITTTKTKSKVSFAQQKPSKHSESTSTTKSNLKRTITKSRKAASHLLSQAKFFG
ncbi:hypothetical protein H4219_004131 [Mycoemilia scoparia]|uniref:Uncharacterized protein n=1 Tax=Mycoemilia scoparia TaxID=417184 RepID=A0A9W7ZSM5_9FUNG|nr:hypothetical protein H4219_004131 [Mycoemilia scoparia]